VHPSSSAEPSAATWRLAGRRLVAKALAEWSYEQLLTPVADGAAWRVDLPSATYRFAARRTGFDGWHIDAGSVTRDGEPATDAVRLVLDARDALGLDAATAAEVVRELTATHAADARILAGARPASELADLGYAELEQHLTGHPVLVLNKGRLGFTASDLERYAPEAHGTVTVRWYAASPDVASYAGVPGLDQSRLLREELDPDVLAGLHERLAARVEDPAGWVWLPVHPYQEDVVVRTLFTAHLADGRLVALGEGPAAYRPVQSVRTLVRPGARDVKVPLFMRNTLVWRGLGTAATAAAPAVSAWLADLHAQDPALQATGLGLMTEVASVVVRHDAYDALPEAPYRYGELLGAVWRTPVSALLRDGERARSMACLLHVDPDGRALLAELVGRSGLDARTWLEHLYDALLPGLLHCLVVHGLAFCPHGENTVLVFRDDVPVRALIKDFAEDVTLLPDRDYPGLSAEADAVVVRWPAQELAHSILSAVLAGHVRFLAPLVQDCLGLPEGEVWDVVRQALLRWRAEHPDLTEQFDALGLLAPDIERIALNREHLTGGGFHDRAERDAAPDVVHGRVPNPLAAVEVRA
jgi:siderophore synthetase component